jgi:hypothetical protein
MLHDLDLHAVFLAGTHSDIARCEVLGRSLFALRKVGEKLSVDRIDPSRGYVEGNMRLLTLTLNKEKGDKLTIPRGSMNRILKGLWRTVDDRHSAVPGAIIAT